MARTRYSANTFLRPDGADRIRFYKTVPHPDGGESFVLLGDQKLSEEAWAVRQIPPRKRPQRRSSQRANSLDVERKLRVEPQALSNSLTTRTETRDVPPRISERKLASVPQRQRSTTDTRGVLSPVAPESRPILADLESCVDSQIRNIGILQIF